MKLKLTEKAVTRLAPEAKPYDCVDTDIGGLLLRVQPSGMKAWYLKTRMQDGRRVMTKLGDLDALTPEQARRKARTLKAAIALDNEDPGKVRRKNPTLEAFLDADYGPWLATHLKQGEQELKRLKVVFKDLLSARLSDLSAWRIEKWRAARLKEGTAAATCNRDLNAFRAMLNRAVEWGVVLENPLGTVKRLRSDSKPKVRFLTPEEERALLDALAKRDEGARKARERANAWRADRGYPLFPAIPPEGFADALTPVVVLSLNTGLRRGEVFGLTWEDVDLDKRLLTVRGATAKSGKTRHVPLNSVAAEVLRRWRVQGNGAGLVFPSPKTGGRLDNLKKSWTRVLKDAGISAFRWHDMRHHCASRLVQAGVDLYVVKEILGHSSVAMTEKYAHLRPEQAHAAVERIVEPSPSQSEIASASAKAPLGQIK